MRQQHHRLYLVRIVPAAKTTTLQKPGPSLAGAIDLLQNPDRRRRRVLAGAWVDRLVFLSSLSPPFRRSPLDAMLTLNKKAGISGSEWRAFSSLGARWRLQPALGPSPTSRGESSASLPPPLSDCDEDVQGLAGPSAAPGTAMEPRLASHSSRVAGLLGGPVRRGPAQTDPHSGPVAPS